MPQDKGEGDEAGIKLGNIHIYLQKQGSVRQMVNDVLIGIFFVLGSIFNFMEAAEWYGNVSYLAGSMILAGRSIRTTARQFTVKSEWKQKQNYHSSLK